jgi:hypothetical protein
MCPGDTFMIRRRVGRSGISQENIFTVQPARRSATDLAITSTAAVTVRSSVTARDNEINRYELSPAPTPQDLETLSFLQTTQRDCETRLASLADGMTKLTAAIWNDLRELLTVNGVAPTLPGRPFVELLLRQRASTQHLFLRWHEFAALPDSSTSDHRSCTLGRQYLAPPTRSRRGKEDRP